MLSAYMYTPKNTANGMRPMSAPHLPAKEKQSETIAEESTQSIPSKESLSKDMLLRLRAQRSSFLPE